jgi:alanyl-tRNA synthetase
MSVYEGLTESQQFACKVIADHARATAFAITDGILPGNEGRNYVLRKIMRRAIYHGREHLGFKEPFFFKVCDTVVDQMHGAFPELAVQREFIGKMVRLEEERFGSTLTVGLKKLNELIDSRTSDDSTIFIHQFAPIKDTFGLPNDLILVVAESRNTFVADFHQEGAVENLTENPEEFQRKLELAIQNLQKQSDIGKTKQNDKINPIYVALERTSIRSNFHGYETTKLDESEVIALVRDDKRVEEIKEGEEGLVVLKDTPFYAESGGQVGDSGVLFNADAQLKVQDTFAPISGIVLHKSKVESGSLKVGDRVTAVVDSFKRDATRRNHTATHLLHAALKEVLGTHVKQAGSVVAPNYLRFDFSHYQPMSDAEIQEVEDLVNRYVLQNHQVTTNLMAIEEAMRSGAVAMFGEKYGAEVRVLSVGDGKFSMELCGGTHVRATGDIGSFKITSDEAIASGVRRIRAITGLDAFERFRDDERLIDRSLEALKTQRDNLPNAIERLQEEVKRTRKEIEELKLKIATGAASGASSNEDEAREIAGVKVLAKVVDGLDANGQRQLSDTLLARLRSGVVVLGRKDEGKASIIVRVSDDLKDRVKAGNVIKEIVPIIGGKGGGRPDMAEGGGPDADKLNDAIEAGYKVIETFLGP